MVVQPRGHDGAGGGNRRRLVEAGYQMLSERGLDATTVKELARVVGVSPGLFHYYFASKDELLLAVFAEEGERFKGRLLDAVGGLADGRDRIEAAVRFVEETADREPQLFRLRYELYALGLRRPEFLPVVDTQLGHIRANIARILGQWFPRADPDRTRALAAVILACFDGLGLQHIAGAGVEIASAHALLRRLMEAELLTPANSPAGPGPKE